MPEAQPRKPKVLVVYDYAADWNEADTKVLHEYLDMMRQGLTEEGYTFEFLEFYDDLSALDRYDPREWLIFNWGEEWAGQPWTEAKIAEEYERRGFAYTGATPATLRFAQNRAQVKDRLLAAGLPTLPYEVFSTPEQAAGWTQFPAIVKGANQHASYGISGHSVVQTAAELARQIEYLGAEHKDTALVEPFLDSREFHVAVWGNQQPEALPPVEFVYTTFADIHDRLYTNDWKFDRQSRGYKEIDMPCPAPADRPDWRARLEATALKAYAVMGLRDFGRFDLRMMGDEPQILDVNPNPDLDRVSVLLLGVRTMGKDYGYLVSRIIQFAAERMPRG
jgi:D-alanine-D-alanine ligase-like ATP-grasp enzyme